MLRIHSIVLMLCSCIGFIGHYLQFGRMRVTPWIPAVIGTMIFFSHKAFNEKKNLLTYLPVVLTALFGIITTVMCSKFLPEHCQPLRKKIVFSTMSLSAWITLFYIYRDLFIPKKKPDKR